MRKLIFYPVAVIAYLFALIGVFVFTAYLLLIGKSFARISSGFDSATKALESLSKTNYCAKK